MLDLGHAETLKVKAMYAGFTAAFGIGLWLANSYGAVPFVSAMADSRVPRAATADSPPHEDQPPMPTIQTLEQLNVVLLGGGCSVIFFEADWSFNTAYARRNVVYPLVRTWKARGGDKTVSFFRVDATDQNPVVDNLFERAKGILRIPDASLLIIDHGRITDAVEWAGAEPTGDLFRRLDRLTRPSVVSKVSK